MTNKVNLKVEQDVLDTIKMLQEMLPAEDENEVLKLVLWTFMAFVQGEDDEEWHEHGGCGCGHGHGHCH